MGIATFLIHAITGRTLDGLGDKQDRVGRLDFITDTYGALDILARDPNCQSRYNRDAETEDAPIRIFHGEADDYTPLPACLDDVERRKDAEDGVLIHLDTDQPFSYSDDCIELGPHFGGNPQAAEDAKSRVAAFVKAQFGP